MTRPLRVPPPAWVSAALCAAVLCAVALCGAGTTACLAQGTGAAAAPPAQGIEAMLRAIEQGRGDSLRAQLAALAEARPRDPAVLYLLGVAERDGDKALPYFQAVVENHPGSAWADDALLRLYQYYYAVGAYNTADSYASRLRSEYPRSPLATGRGARPENRGGGADTLRYAAQVGVFASLESARELQERMQRLGYTAELAQKQVGERTVHAVWVGRFATLAEAKAFVGRLRQRHRVDAIPVRR